MSPSNRSLGSTVGRNRHGTQEHGEAAMDHLDTATVPPAATLELRPMRSPSSTQEHTLPTRSTDACAVHSISTLAISTPLTTTCRALLRISSTS